MRDKSFLWHREQWFPNLAERWGYQTPQCAATTPTSCIRVSGGETQESVLFKAARWSQNLPMLWTIDLEGRNISVCAWISACNSGCESPPVFAWLPCTLHQMKQKLCSSPCLCKLASYPVHPVWVLAPLASRYLCTMGLLTLLPTLPPPPGTDTPCI